VHAPKTFNYRCKKNNRCYPLSQYMNVNNVGSRLLSMALIAITHAEIILFGSTPFESTTACKLAGPRGE
jgi:hypothetical protein